MKFLMVHIHIDFRSKAIVSSVYWVLFLLAPFLMILGCDGGRSGDGGSDDTLITWYADSDGDGYGDPYSTTESASQPYGYVSKNLDCDDTDQNINPSSREICNDDKDNDCDNKIDCEDSNCNDHRACNLWNAASFSVNENNFLKNGEVFEVKGGVYIPGYPGYLPWEIENISSASLDERLKNRIAADLENIKLLGANTVRFWGAPSYCYEVIKNIGQLYIIQTIWFDPEAEDFQEESYKMQCRNYIKTVVDRIYSVYPDNNPPLIAFLLGNELSSNSILQTDSLHPEIDSYNGEFINTGTGITATEAFLAEMADYLKDYEYTNYNKISLVSYSNEIRTYNIIDTPFLDFRSHNAYSYAVPHYLDNPPEGSLLISRIN